ncbi:MAG TPA: hypothetical protein VHZ73_02035, partial [Vicinamibacterales bacterium]|nr:hypothetical protein [Vicinamibacterales bacterium]
MSRIRLPHPLVLLGIAVFLAAGLTWVLPAGAFERQNDPVTGRTIVVPGTYHRVPASPVGPFAAAVAIPRGFVEAADVIGVVVFVGGAWVLVDTLGTLPAAVDALAALFAGNGIWMIPIVALFFTTMGALENMQEEIIPMVPALVALAAAVGFDPLVAVAMSAGAAMVGSAFGPTNPFQAGIAMKLAQLPPLSAGGVRLAMLIAGFIVWVGWTMLYAQRANGAAQGSGLRAQDSGLRAHANGPRPQGHGLAPRHALVLLCVVMPMAFYVYGALRLDWGFNELAGAFVIGAVVAGLVGGLGLEATVTTFVAGMQALLPAALMVGVARAISLVLADGKVVDTILNGTVRALSGLPAFSAALLMIPFHALLHI